MSDAMDQLVGVIPVVVTGGVVMKMTDTMMKQGGITGKKTRKRLGARGKKVRKALAKSGKQTRRKVQASGRKTLAHPVVPWM